MRLRSLALLWLPVPALAATVSDIVAMSQAEADFFRALRGHLVYEGVDQSHELAVRLGRQRPGRADSGRGIIWYTLGKGVGE